MRQKILTVRFLIFFLSAVIFLRGQPETDTPTSRSVISRSKLEFGPEFMVPYGGMYQVNAISLNAYYMRPYFKNADLFIAAGFMVMHEWGDFPVIEDGNLTTENFSGTGAGPLLQVQLPVFIKKRFTLEGEANGGIIFYTKKFLPPGDYYNFLFRAGPVIGYRFNETFSVKAGLKWMHVSNGKGFTINNPMHECVGMSFTLTRHFNGTALLN